MKRDNYPRAKEIIEDLKHIEKDMDALDEMSTFNRLDFSTLVGTTSVKLEKPLTDKVIDLLRDEFHSQKAALEKELETL